MTAAITIDQALQWACERGVARLDAGLLLAQQLGRNRTWLMAHGEQAVGERDLRAFQEACARRLDDVPLAYLVGVREFRGLTLGVGPEVLVPRPETELLVDWALQLLNEGPLRHIAAPKVLDLGTGSGAIALAVAAGCPRAFVTATDKSAAALATARDNGRRLELTVRWLEADWWLAIGSDATFDLVLSNPPYVAEGDPHLVALRHEPATALVAGADGLDAIQQITAHASAHVHGWLLLEHGWDQAEAVSSLLRRAGGRDVETRRDLSGQPRCTGARWGAPAG